MQTNPPLIEPNIEVLHRYCKKEDAILKLIFPTKFNQLPHWDGLVYKVKWELCHAIGGIHSVAGKSWKKRR